jgi:hypothetical protein
MSDFLPTLDLFWPRHRIPQFGFGIIKPLDVLRHTLGMWTERFAFQHALLPWRDNISLVEAKIAKYISGICRLAKFYKYLKVIVVITIIIIILAENWTLFFTRRYRISGGGGFISLIRSHSIVWLSLFRPILLKISLHLQPWRKIWPFVFGLTNK